MAGSDNRWKRPEIKNRSTRLKKKCMDCDLIALLFFRRISTQEMQAPDVTVRNRWIKPNWVFEDISPIPYSYSALMSNYVTTSKQMQHSSCPEFARQECFPSSRLSRQTLHTSQWKERSLKILKQKRAHHFADRYSSKTSDGSQRKQISPKHSKNNEKRSSVAENFRYLKYLSHVVHLCNTPRIFSATPTLDTNI